MMRSGLTVVAICAACATSFGQGVSPPPSATRPVPLRPGQIQLVTVGGTPTAKPSPVAAVPPRAAPVREQDPREIFSLANRLYEAGNYQDAVKEYERLTARGYGGGNLYYNIGNACLKLDRKGDAILYYMRALRFRPRDQDIIANLDYARSLLEEKIEPRQISWFLRQWEGAVGFFTLAELRTAAVVIYWILCAILIVFIYARPLRPYLVKVMGVLILILIAVGAGMGSRAYLEGQEQAVILLKEVKVRYGPSDNDVIAFVLHEGSAVKIENVKDSWYQVSLPDGKAGWIRKEDCGRV
ncbi:MAG: tetratricopeptide repeat protein [Candidatus Aureabacteria bacterium]|nr:tetratricopeptide repeat protein [Candidatus Auribacterota bacterium]